MISLYVHGNSILHALRPGTKLVALLLLGTGLFFVKNWMVLFVALMTVVLLYRVVGLSSDAMVRQIKPLAALLLFIFFGHVMFTDWLSGWVTVLRILVLVLLAAAVTLTTRMSDMVDTLTAFARPLARFGVNPDKLSLMLALTVRYIPLILNRYTDLREAQQVRGGRSKTLSLLLPLLIQSLKLADQLAEAIDARAYENGFRDASVSDSDGLSSNE